MARTRPEVDATQVQNALRCSRRPRLRRDCAAALRPEQQRNYSQEHARCRPSGARRLRSATEVSPRTRRAHGDRWLVLLIACANVANCCSPAPRYGGGRWRFASHSARRRGRVIRQLLTESLLLSIARRCPGCSQSRDGGAGARHVSSPAGKPIFLDLRLDATVLWFSVRIAVLTGLAFGLAPGVARGTRRSQRRAQGQRTRHRRRARRLTAGKALVVAQLAISLTLIIGRRAAARDVPPDLDRRCRLRSRRRADRLARQAEVGQVERAAARGEVCDSRADSLDVGSYVGELSQLTPLGNSTWNEEISDRGFTPKSEDDGIAYFNEVSDGYFRTMGTPLLVGRDFNGNDRVGTLAVAIINETMARRFYGASNPVGKTFRYREGRASRIRARSSAWSRTRSISLSARKRCQQRSFLSRRTRSLGPTFISRRGFRAGAAAAIPSVKSAIEGSTHISNQLRTVRDASCQHADRRTIAREPVGILRRLGVAARDDGTVRRHGVQRGAAAERNRHSDGARGRAAARCPHGRRRGHDPHRRGLRARRRAVARVDAPHFDFSVRVEAD